MRIAVLSNDPTIRTGYGVQCGLLVDRLAGDGHEVAVFATFGQAQGMGKWTSPGGHEIPIYWCGFTTSGDDIVHMHVDHWFKGDPTSGWIIPLIDVWSLTNPLYAEWNVAAWAPVDHDPIPPIVIRFFDNSKATPIAMTRHGFDQFKLAGFEPSYAPLAVDTKLYKPTFALEIGGEQVKSRELFNLDERAFVIGVVAMNKDPHRKAFAEILQGFAKFYAEHPDARLFMHTESYGLMGGTNIPEVAKTLGIPDHAIIFSNPYAYRAGFSEEMMSAAYTAMDVLLCPSYGEGFCVPMIEAQACGVPVIASDFTAQAELVGAGWTVGGQKWWDHGSHAWYQCPNVDEIVARLEDAYNVPDWDQVQSTARTFAEQYDADVVFDTYWRPLLEQLPTDVPPADKPLMTDVAVIVPAMKRPQNVNTVVESFNAHNDGTATLYFVCDADDAEQIAAVEATNAKLIISDRGTTFAAKVNDAYFKTTESFLFLAGDDVEFTLDWLQNARPLSDRYDIIGTNDSEYPRVRNPKVAAGTHADHFFIRRSYCDERGGSLEGPGLVVPECYHHFFTDTEVIQLGKARGVFTPCLKSIVVHHHPGFDGREDLREADPVYMKAVEFSDNDQTQFKRRLGLIDQQKVVRRGIWE